MIALAHRMWSLKWTRVYIALIPFVNWSFTWAPEWAFIAGLVRLREAKAKPVAA